ncbi:regulatory LuxR family protein [Antricoccus suffuscus]|uniref:Regulatory LuxR family protein n=1 Tax=Antricoccus suffuscus TaxID=1629062 RepID=A0A2T1A140_9ACTN|nr:AAA family ATPase [Antricoccus suffuscus]PRZ42048.1 regulatory LuxR family protein [Antricoccus suffuscus]
MSLEQLTPRERAVAEIARSGASTRIIAERLVVSVRTVETHLGTIYRKLGLRNRAELVALLHALTPSENQPGPAAATYRMPAELVAPSDFVGRQPELELCRDAIRRARGGHPSTLMIGGEPGVGKSALVAQVAAEASSQAVRVLAGRCESDFRAPFRPVTDALRHYLSDPRLDLREIAGPTAGSLASILPDLADRLPEPYTVEDPATARRQLVDAIVATIASACDAGPVLLIIEDMHCADHATLGVVRHIVESAAVGTLALVGTFRNTELAREHPLPGLLANMWRQPSVRRIDLNGLSAEETAELVGRATSAASPSGLTQLHSRTGGNPFFIRQLLRQGSTGAAPTGVPASVKEVVIDRATRLGPSALHLLETAAVLGSEFDIHLLLEIMSAAEERAAVTLTIEDLENAGTARFITELPEAPGRFRFVHELVREAFIEQLSALSNARLHQLAGHAVLKLHSTDISEHLIALAAHFHAAVPLGDGLLAAEYAAAAARQAIESLAPEDALRLAALGLADLPKDSGQDRLRLDLLLIEVDASATRMDLVAHQRAMFDAIEVARRIGDPVALARTLDRHTVLPAMGSIDEELLAVKLEAIDALGEHPSPLRTRLLASASYQRTIGGHGWRAADQARQAVRDARTLRDPDGVIAGLYALAAARLGGPDLGAQMEVAEELTTLGLPKMDLAPERDGRRFRAVLALAGGDRGGFEADGVSLSQVGNARGSVFIRSLSAEWSTLGALLDGDLDRAESLANATVALAADDPNFLLGWLAQLAAIRVEQDRAGEFVPLADGTLAEHPHLLVVRALCAGLHTEAGDLEGGRALVASIVADGFDAVGEDWLRPATLGYLAPVVRDCFGPMACQSLAGLLAPYSGQLLVAGAGALVLGAADHFRGLLLSAAGPMHWQRAADAFAAATDLADRVGGRALAAHTHIEHARHLLGRGSPTDRADAATLLEKSRVDGKRLGLTRVSRLVEDITGAVASPHARLANDAGATSG